MRLETWTRQTHRWVSIAFTAAVLLNIVLVALQRPAEWAYFLPLPPLALLMLSGLYLFARPYLSGRRAGRARHQQPQ